MNTLTLTERLKAASMEEHSSAERHPFVASLVAGTLPAESYYRYLKALSATYQSLESAIAAVLPLAELQTRFGLARSSAIESDLAVFRERTKADEQGPYRTNQYTQQIEKLASDWPNGLISHFYTRYLGDLSGGQMLKRFVAKGFELNEDDGTRFYQFEKVDSPKEAKSEIKATLDALVFEEQELRKLEEECSLAFQLSRKLFDFALPETSLSAQR